MGASVFNLEIPVGEVGRWENSPGDVYMRVEAYSSKY